MGTAGSRDAAERQRAVSRFLRRRLVLPPDLDRPTTRRLASLDEAVAAALSTGDHDRLLDDQAVSGWPAALTAVVGDVLRRLPSAAVTVAPDPVRGIVEQALSARLGFGPGSGPDSPVLLAHARVAEARRALEARGWTRVVPAARDDALAQLVSDTLGARAVVTRHLRRVHLEVLPRYGATATPGSSLAVLSSTGTLVVVELGRPRPAHDDLAAFRPFLVAVADLATVQDRNDADARMHEQR